MQVFKQKQTHINIISFLLQESTHIKQITSIGKMLKSSFLFCDSDQIAMSSRNVQTSLFRFFRRDAFFFYFYFFRHFQNIYITNTDITQQHRQRHYLYIHFQLSPCNKPNT